MNRASPVTSLLCLIALTLSGCIDSGSSPATRSAIHIKADNLLMQGVRSGARGDQRDAERLFLEALGVSASIDDSDGRTKALINLSRLKRHQKDLDGALSNSGEALRLVKPESDYFADALFEKALVELARGNSSEARGWASKAVINERDSRRLGGRLNLVARIRLGAGDHSAAETTAENALEMARKNKEIAEEANSLRIIGIVKRQRTQFVESEKLLLEALEIDRTIGKSSKVALDLEELSATSRAAGLLEKALSYLQRAFEVHLNSGRLAQAAANLELQADLQRTGGSGAHADELLKKAEEVRRKEAAQLSESRSPATANPSSRP